MIHSDFLHGNFPLGMNLLCPRCQKFALEENPKESKSLKQQRFADEHFAIKWGGQIWESSLEIRSSIYNCRDTNCKQDVLVVQEIRGEVNREMVQLSRLEGELYSFKSTILFMQPSINIITVPENMDSELSSLLKQSFQLYWIDLDSCVNKLRAFLEKLLDDLKIRKQRIVLRAGNRTVKKLSLGERIGELKQHSEKYSGFGDSIKAIKWIGNVGSHGSDSVTTERAIQAFKITEYLLNEIYSKKSEEIKKIVKKINEKKGK